MEDNKLVVKDENGKDRVITVFDIVDKKGLFNKKTFMIYMADDEPGKIYASYLHETVDSFSLDTISDPKDIAFANKLIDKAIEEYFQ